MNIDETLNNRLWINSQWNTLHPLMPWSFLGASARHDTTWACGLNWP